VTILAYIATAALHSPKPTQAGYSVLLVHQQCEADLHGGGRDTSKGAMLALAFIDTLRTIPSQHHLTFIVDRLSGDPTTLREQWATLALIGRHCSEQEATLWRQVRLMLAKRGAAVAIRPANYASRELYLMERAEGDALKMMWKHGPRPRAKRKLVTDFALNR